MAEATTELAVRVMATVRRFLAQAEIAYQVRDDDGSLAGVSRGDSGVWQWTARCIDGGELLLIATHAPIFIPKKRRAAVSEYLSLVNWELIFGNFEMGWSDGRVIFRTSIPLAGRRPPVPVLAHQFAASRGLMDLHLPGIMAVAYGKVSPKGALRRLERENARARARAAAQNGQGSSVDQLRVVETQPESNIGPIDISDERRPRRFTSEN